MTHSPVHSAGNSPIKTALQAGKTYAWCACGRSMKQPFCDGSHQGTGIDPVIFTAEVEGDVWLCLCKKANTAPTCDGSHKK
ncbi:CDGSH iron-sulfur domain-containing protein [Neptuniibacter sp. 2_MG-2023]|uniref:CDGSH iron-sulfur domain-containing protein n=1 Tax=Neptuniibacter sp. 2_MG-2023 TaxID=3062671 RepID=UPI0026E22CA9|nr:CDGSH iron-sulfur domain-containing protein [Neptuniibacter sp. 2_MG-2023]MDO6515174.1 CDGSH iron-sulfur domain-containing protein [Neptuniibacter sp. 2_MG-2023]